MRGGTLGVVSRVTGERRFDVRPSRLGAWAAPLMGMAFAFAWTPCIGPVLGVVLGLAANNGTLPGGVLLLFAYSRPPADRASGYLRLSRGHQLVAQLVGDLERMATAWTRSHRRHARCWAPRRTWTA